MAKYTVCFMATGGIEVEAKDVDEARSKFLCETPYDEIIENLSTNGVEITEIFGEG